MTAASLTDIRKGDRVRITIEADVTGLGVTPSEPGIETPLSWASGEEIVSVEKIGPSLPTKPGLYTIATSDEGIASRRVFRLTTSGWKEDGKDMSEAALDHLRERVSSGRWVLRRLVLEAGEGHQ